MYASRDNWQSPMSAYPALWGSNPIRPFATIDTSKEVLSKQADQATRHDQHAKARTLQVRQQVFVRNFGSGPLWIAQGVIENILGPVSYLVRVQNNEVWKRHIDHIKEWTGTSSIQPAATQTSELEDCSFSATSESSDAEDTSPSSPIRPATPTTRPRHRYLTRERHQPNRVVLWLFL